ncbi:MAG: DinB family protein [Dehalococcoidia bacterium]
MTGPPDEARERVRGYLLTQGERYDWVGLWPRVIGARVELLNILDGVTEQQAAFDPGGEDWSIAEVAHHVLNSARGTAATVEHLAKGEQPPEQTRVDPQREPPAASFVETRRALAEQSVQWAALVAKLPEPPSLELTWPHMFFGDLHCRAWFLFQRIHDQDHMGQVQQVKDASGYPKAED